jgi:hypothetical protein
MHCQQGGEVWAWNGLLDAFRRFSGGFEPFPGSIAHRSDRSRSPVWPVRVLALFTCCTPVWPVVLTGLTGQGWVVAAALFQVVFCMHSSRGSCSGSGGACMCAGELFVVFRALVWCFALFAWAVFCLRCVEPFPLRKGSETCLLQVIFLLAFDRLLEFLFVRLFSFCFPSCYFRVGVVNALIKGEIEDHVLFEDRWMVASLCYEWLTTLCGLILG